MNANGPAVAQKDVVPESKAESLRGGVTFSPRVDILETDKELFLYADLPGVKSEDVELRFEKGELTLVGHIKPRFADNTAFRLQEYQDGDFHRVFQTTEAIDATKIEASCKQGVLTVRLPKVEAVQPRSITVKAQ
jgi:HSP20 family protein